MLLVQMAAPSRSEFPVDVWNSYSALESLALCGYYEPPLYHWNEEYLEGQPWYEVRLTILAHIQATF